jgi:hypothetical protein
MTPVTCVYAYYCELCTYWIEMRRCPINGMHRW